jgi:hypothetical protein
MPEPELQVDSQRTQNQQNITGIGIGDRLHEVLARRGAVIDNLRSLRMEDFRAPIEALDLLSFEIDKKLLLIRRDQVQQVIVERFFFGECLGLANGLLGQVRIPAAFGNETA